LPGLIPGILLGTYLGGSLAHILTEGAVRIIFAAVPLWMGIRYLGTPKPQPEEESIPVEKGEKNS
jgi:uncharacterized membrane protein YfcA